MVEEELHGIDSDVIGNLEDLLRLVLINQECWNPKVVADGAHLLEILAKRRRRRFTSL